MSQKLLKYLPWAVVVFIALLWLKSCNNDSKERADIEKSWAYKEQMYLHNESTLIRDTTKKGEELVVQKQLLVDEKTAHNMDIIENERLKKINSEVRVLTTSEVRNITTAIIDTFFVDTSSGDTISKRLFWINKKWYGVNGTILKESVVIDSMYFNNELVVTIGYEKKGTFKKSEPVVDIINKNPHSSVNEVYNVVIKPKKKMFYETTWFKVGAGALGGIWLSSKI